MGRQTSFGSVQSQRSNKFSFPAQQKVKLPSGGWTIDGYYIPEGTTVSCQAYSVHRMDEQAFHDAGSFNPHRWFCGEVPKNTCSFFAFADGGRGCIGKQYAHL